MHEQWLAKFAARVDRSAGPDACWPWTGCRQPKGYGHFYPAWRVNLYAHRVAWEIANGAPVPAGQHVMHSCDNPSCCNPAHLSVGTHSDNMRDMVSKGRAARKAPAGEAHHNAKLDVETVAEIVRMAKAGVSQRDIAKRFGVVRGTVQHVLKGRSWKSAAKALRCTTEAA